MMTMMSTTVMIMILTIIMIRAAYVHSRAAFTNCSRESDVAVAIGSAALDPLN